MPERSNLATVRSFSAPGGSRLTVDASSLPALIAAGELDLEDEYLDDAEADIWRVLWRRPGIPTPAHWGELTRHRRADMEDRKDRVRRGEWTRTRYFEWRAQELRLAAGAGMPTVTAASPASASTQDSAWPDEPIPPHIREAYECIGPIGQGGSGSVYRIRRHITHAECALKVTKPGIGRDAVINELKALAQVRSQFVVGWRDHFKMTNDRWLIITEYVPGMTLREFQQFQTGGRIADPAMLERLLTGIARGLADLHQHGLVHRDLKPANIILRDGPDGTVMPVIIDLGMARGAQPSGNTLQGGTPGYQSPEQEAGMPCTPASDIFAFGLSAYELVTGRRMAGFQHATLHEVCSALPALVDQIVKHECANARAEKRIQDGGQLLQRLESAFVAVSGRALATPRPSTASAGARAAGETAREAASAPERQNHDPNDLDARARRGDAHAMIQLAHQLESATATPADLQRATHWYAKAADAGHVDAMASLGWRLLRGIGTPAKPREALQWIRRAADAGNAGAMADLGWCLLNGVGVDRDAAAAVKWYRRAADRGDRDGMTGLAWCLATGTGTSTEAPTAIEWYRRAADRGAFGAMHDLGCCLLRGIGTRRDPVEGVRWLRQAAEGGLRAAMGMLGWCLESGNGTERDPVEAARWYERAASAGDAAAMNDFGACLLHSIGVAENQAAAANWFKRGAEAGNPDAMLNLVQCLATGTGTAQNTRASERWLRRAREAARNTTHVPALLDGNGPVGDSIRP